ncbi:MAG: DUF4097 family beta strand repeat-containing protein [Chryseolinea sp.]
MKRILNVALFCGLCLTAAAQGNDNSAYLNKSLSKDAIKEVYARTSGGGILVTGVSESEARIEVYVRSNNNDNLSKDEAKKRIEEDYDLEVTASSGKLTATARPKLSNMNSKRSLSISFRIYAPKNVSTDLGTSGGNIDLNKLTGAQEFKTSGGSLTLDELSGKLDGKTSGGNISLSNITSDEVELTTSGGRITAENCRGNLELSTSGGNIDLEKLKGRIEAKTSGGTIRGTAIDGELITHTSGGSINLKDFSGSVDASTSGGNIDMEIIKVGKYITASNSGGNIKLKMPANLGMDLKLRAEHFQINSLKNFTGDQDEHKITGKMNGGGVPVDISTNGTLSMALE